MNKYFTKYTFLFTALLCSSLLNAQSLTTNPCAEPPASEWTVGGGCVATSTAGFTNLFDPGSCNSGIFDDGWAWYIGTGAQNTITYTPDPGMDAIIHLFEVPDPAVCSVIELGCSDAGGAGVTESIVGGGILGTLYYIRIQAFNTNATLTGCLDIVANPATCDDGIQNGGEAGVDCGGPCVTTCPPPPSNSTLSCPSVVNSILDTTTCILVGTAGFNSGSGFVNFTGGAFTPPSTAPCFTAPTSGQNTGAWALYDPVNGVSAASFNINPDNVTGANDINIAFYQGSCAGLTEVGCGQVLTKSGPNYILNPINVTGIDDSQPLYVFIHSSRAFSISEAQLIGFESSAPNDDCASATVANENGCNLAATPSAFTPPSNFSPTICSGGTWYSNENTVFYSFTPSTSDATLEIDNIACNDGLGGLAQFGVWESCAAMSLAPTAANGFLGCVVGTDPLVLSGLTVGQTYFIAVDGNAGDWCSWNFVSTGGIILLRTRLKSFTATPIQAEVLVDWETEDPIDKQYFTVQRSVDAIEFVDINNPISQTANSGTYNSLDTKPLPGVSYYRLKTEESDGSYSYSDVVAVTRANVDLKDKFFVHGIYPQPFSEFINIDLEPGAATSLDFKLMNNLGQCLIEKSIAVTPNSYNRLTVELGQLDAGIYTLIIEDEITKATRIERIIKR